MDKRSGREIVEFLFDHAKDLAENSERFSGTMRDAGRARAEHMLDTAELIIQTFDLKK